MTGVRFETCCFSGHRVIPEDVREPLREALEREIRFLVDCCECYRFCSGGAAGFDLMAAQVVLELKKENPQLELWMILPFERQAARWSTEEILEYSRIIALADNVKYIGEEYFPGCYRRRNQRLVDESDFCLYYMTRKKSGTGMTVAYANQKGIKIRNLAEDPLVLERNQWGTGETAGNAPIFSENNLLEEENTGD